ncbi:MAG: adenosine kinase [Zetaproteobacteria bacterium]|nr:adenosine kinase [Zetaproteobacteria bacterium]
MSYDVYGVGNAIMDLQVQCDDDFLTANGIEKGIMTLTEPDRQQAILKALSDHDVNYCSGGSAANTVVGIADMGGKTAYASQTARDAFGQQYLDEFKALGVATHVEAVDGDTGTCVVLITPDAQRTMLTHLGVSVGLKASDLDEEAIAKSKYIYVEGYLFAGPETKKAALKAIDIAKRVGTKVALTVSDPFLIDICRDDFQALIENAVDLLFCNEVEACALTGEADPTDAARALHQHVANVAVTLGKEGSIVLHQGDVFSVAGVPIKAMDTTGAGDMYAAGVLYGITHDFTWQQAGRLGSHAAAKVVAQLGARLPAGFGKEAIEAVKK